MPSPAKGLKSRGNEELGQNLQHLVSKLSVIEDTQRGLEVDKPVIVFKITDIQVAHSDHCYIIRTFSLSKRLSTFYIDVIL